MLLGCTCFCHVCTYIETNMHLHVYKYDCICIHTIYTHTYMYSFSDVINQEHQRSQHWAYGDELVRLSQYTMQSHIENLYCTVLYLRMVNIHNIMPFIVYHLCVCTCHILVCVISCILLCVLYILHLVVCVCVLFILHVVVLHLIMYCNHTSSACNGCSLLVLTCTCIGVDLHMYWC